MAAVTDRVNLDSSSQRVKWAEFLVHSHENASTFAKFEGTGEAASLIVSTDKNEGTFYIEAVQVISDAPVGVDEVLVDSPTHQHYKSVVGYRTSYAQQVPVRKFEETLTSRDLFAEVVKGLGLYWARVYDALIGNYASAYSVSVSSGAGASTIAQVYNPSLAANITALEAILNLAGIGTSNAASSKEVNAFFATMSGSTPLTNPDADTWDDMKTNPSNYYLTPGVFDFLGDYLQQRGVPPVNLEFDGITGPHYLAFIPSPAITMLRRNSEYINARNSGTVGGMEMWSGKMRLDRINNILLVPWNNPYPYSVSGVTGGTLARVADAGTSHYAVESIIMGGQGIAVSSYDEFEVIKAAETDFNRKNKIGFDIVKGAKDIRRIDTNTDVDSIQDYKNTCSLCHTMPKWN